MSDTEKKLSPNADRVLLFEYIRANGMPDSIGDKTDPHAVQIEVFRRIAGLSEYDAIAAYAEAEDAGMIERM